MGTVGVICVLVKYCPKREKILGKIIDNVEGKFDEETTNQQASKLDKRSVTRWRVRTECFRKIKKNF